jgi:hypothetical protein
MRTMMSEASRQFDCILKVAGGEHRLVLPQIRVDLKKARRVPCQLLPHQMRS